MIFVQDAPPELLRAMASAEGLGFGVWGSWGFGGLGFGGFGFRVWGLGVLGVLGLEFQFGNLGLFSCADCGSMGVEL